MALTKKHVMWLRVSHSRRVLFDSTAGELNGEALECRTLQRKWDCECPGGTVRGANTPAVLHFPRQPTICPPTHAPTTNFTLSKFSRTKFSKFLTAIKTLHYKLTRINYGYRMNSLLQPPTITRRLINQQSVQFFLTNITITIISILSSSYIYSLTN